MYSHNSIMTNHISEFTSALWYKSNITYNFIKYEFLDLFGQTIHPEFSTYSKLILLNFVLELQS